MKKHLANIVTSSRIIGAFVLFTFSEFSLAYIIIYCFCGFTDLIDGPIARKTNSANPLGAALDTIGDVLTDLSLVKILVIQKLVPGYILSWLGVLIIFGFVLAFFALRKFNKFFIPHTYLNKALGFFIFIMPIMINIMAPEIWFTVLCTILSIVIIEAFVIQIKNDEAMDFVPTIFHLKK